MTAKHLLPMEYKLTQHFSYEEMVRSETADRNGINNIPTTDIIVNWTNLCEFVLERIRAHYKWPYNKKWVKITSGFRCKALNTKIGGSSRSQHIHGYAADIVVNTLPVVDVFNWLNSQTEIQFDQAVLEYSNWIHISYVTDKNRCQSLKYYWKDGKRIREIVPNAFDELKRSQA